MSKLLMFVLAMGGGYAVYRKTVYEPPAFQAFKRFQHALSQGECGPLKEMAVEAAAAKVDEYCTPKTISVMGVTKTLDSAAGMVNDMAKSPGGMSSRSKYTLESLEESGGVYTLKVRDAAVGRSSAMNPLRGPITRVGKLRETAAGSWQVLEYGDEGAAAAN